MSETNHTEAKRRPVRTFRSGAIGASIWQESTDEGGTYHTITLSRAWKSPKTGKDGYSKNFLARNEADIVSAVRMACEAARGLEGPSS